MIIADMHTHSNHSHDSQCKMVDLITAEINNGSEVLAVTDHFDVCWVDCKDIFTCVVESNREIEEQNKVFGDKIKILKGVEISEAIWNLDAYHKVMEMSDYDVVIGSVHCVRGKAFSGPYAVLDFTTLTKEQLEEFMSSYFDDIMEMLELTDFDILAHLTCPLRYIFGKYKLSLDMSQYDEKIDKILKTIISRKIALEVNTSSYDVLDDFMPTRQIIKRYYELGGRMITLASDSHMASRAAFSFDKAINYLKEVGFEGIYTFEQRKPKLLKF